MKHIRVALVQMAPKLGLVTENAAEHRRTLAACREAGDQLVVFPELSLTGYQLKDLVAEVALSPAEMMALFADLGAGPAIEFVVGYMERSPGARAYNSLAHLALDENGELRLLHNHRKLNLPTYGMFEEERYFAKGRSLRAYDSPLLGRSGLLICEDMWHPANPLLLSLDGPSLEGVRVLLVGSDSPARGVGGLSRRDTENAVQWDLLARYTAMTAGCAVLVSQRVGVEDGFVFTGGSQVVLPGGVELVRAPLFEEAVLRAEIPLDDAIRRFRVVPGAGPQEDFERFMREGARIMIESDEGSDA